jgi:hypothetical protein
MRLTLRFRSGLKEGFDIALRHRKLLEPFDLVDRLLRDFRPLFTAWSAVWAKGTPAAIEAANQLVDQCADLLSVSVEKGRGGNRAHPVSLG